MARLKKPVVRAVTEASKFGEKGVSGLKHFSGRIDEDHLRELQGYRGIKKLDEFRRNDAIAGGVLRAMGMLTRSVDWTVWPCEDERFDGETRFNDALYLEQCMADMEEPWPAFISGVSTMYWAGHALAEEVFKVRAGMDGKPPSTYDDFKIGWAKMAFRAQESLEQWAIGPHGEILGVTQRDPAGGGVYDIPADKFILFRTSTEKNNPMGESVLRTAYIDWTRKTGKEEIGAIALERDGTGIPEFRVPGEIMAPNANAAMQAQFRYFQAMGRNIRTDEQACIILPSDIDPTTGKPLYEFRLVASPGSRQFNLDAEIARHNSAIAISCLAQFILLGTRDVGSFALADSQTSIFAVALGGYLDMIAEQLNRVAIPRLWAVNGWRRPTPYIKHGDIETQDIAALSGMITALTGAGIDLTDPATENEIRRIAGLPQTAEEGTSDLIGDGSAEGEGPGSMAHAPLAAAGYAAQGSGILSTVGGLNALMDLMARVQSGALAESNAIAVMEEVFGIEPASAARMLRRDETVRPVDAPAEHA